MSNLLAAVGSAATKEAVAKGTSAYRVRFLALLILLMGFNIIERRMIGLLAEPIKGELFLTDLQLGILGGAAFALFYGVMAVPIAWITDRVNRVTLIAVCATIWSAFSALCGAAHNFWHLLFARAGLGVGEAGFAPAAYSLISDLYPPQQRAIAIGFFSLGVPFGTIAGSIIGAWVAESIGWRASFIWLGVFGVLAALLFRGTVREPARGQYDPGGLPGVAPPFRTALVTLSKKRAYIHLVAAQSLTTLTSHGISVWAAVYLMRQYDFGLIGAGLFLAFSIGLGEAAGGLLGGVLTRQTTQRDLRWYGWLPSIAGAVTALLYVSAFVQSDWRVALPLVILAELASRMCAVPVFSGIQNMVGTRMRGTSVAVLMFFGVIVGVGGGPMLIGWLSDAFGAISFGSTDYLATCNVTADSGALATDVASACASASAIGIRYALIGCSLVGFWASLHYFLASRTLRQDLIYGSDSSGHVR